MIFREANSNDISEIQRVRTPVSKNRLSNPALVADRKNPVKYSAKFGSSGFLQDERIERNRYIQGRRIKFEMSGIGWQTYQLHRYSFKI
ncbi:MAG TPA: hypothetical protein VG847_03050 [Chitinophagaceae bacterium]|nr:hypothetical protein [Chitinophagaceae bacterium]